MLLAKLSAVAVLLLAVLSATAQTPSSSDPAAERALRHATVEWASIAEHLPDPQRASPADLLVAADILRARKLPDDALEYYHYALDRGGDPVKLWNRIGVAELEVNQVTLARLCFRRVLAMRPKDAEVWNNLGATEMIDGNAVNAVQNYQKALKIERRNALFHANLGTAYFMTKDYDSARHQYQVALKLDPDVFARGGFGGTQIHVLNSQDRGRFAFEMARLAAEQHQEASLFEWMEKAIEAGFDVRRAMDKVSTFDGYRKDPRLTVLLENAKALRGKQIAASGPVPVLPAVK